MAKLMIATKRARRTGPGLRVGGRPVAPAGTPWPRCGECGGRMGFLAQIPLAGTGVVAFAWQDQLLLVFQCQNNPGLCDDWEPDAGGNAALVVAAGGPSACRRRSQRPPTGPTASKGRRRWTRSRA